MPECLWLVKTPMPSLTWTERVGSCGCQRYWWHWHALRLPIPESKYEPLGCYVLVQQKPPSSTQDCPHRVAHCYPNPGLGGHPLGHHLPSHLNQAQLFAGLSVCLYLSQIWTVETGKDRHFLKSITLLNNKIIVSCPVSMSLCLCGDILLYKGWYITVSFLKASPPPPHTHTYAHKHTTFLVGNEIDGLTAVPLCWALHDGLWGLQIIDDNFARAVRGHHKCWITTIKINRCGNAMLCKTKRQL